MGIFGSRQTAQQRNGGPIYTKELRSLEEERELLRVGAEQVMAACAVAEARLREKFPEVLASAIAEHDADVAAYSFECKRWGDFMSLFIQRGETKYATSVNLRDTREMRLDAGTKPDMEGTIRYYATQVSDDGPDRGTTFSRGRGFDFYPARPGHHYEARSSSYDLIPRRRMFSLDAKDGGNYMHYSGEVVRYQTKDAPRFATDDRIRFEGIGATVYAPAGLGQGVHAAILSEIAATSMA